MRGWWLPGQPWLWPELRTRPLHYPAADRERTGHKSVNDSEYGRIIFGG
jgi:hypothetical protein